MAPKNASSARNKRILPIVAGVAVAAGLFAWALASGMFGGTGGIAVDSVYVVDDDTLLVVGASGRRTSAHRSQIALIEDDGALRNAQIQKGSLNVLGVSDARVWLHDHERGYHARSLPDLELLEGMNAAIEEHPVLSNRIDPKGFTDDVLVVVGADDETYALTPQGSIESWPEDGAYTPKGKRRPTGPGPEDPDALRALSQAVAKSDNFETGSLITGQRTADALRLDDPPSVLVESREFVKGGKSETLHRVKLDDTTPMWSVNAEALMDALELEGQLITIEWVGLRAGKVVALLQLSEYTRTNEGDNLESHLHKLVTIDPADGSVLEAKDVVPEET